MSKISSTRINKNNTKHRKSFNFKTEAWDFLGEIALEKGWPNRNQFVIYILKKVIADYQQEKSHDLDARSLHYSRKITS